MHAYEEKTWEQTHIDEQLHGRSPVIRLHPNDDVVIARQQLVGGTRLREEGIVVAGLIPPGHKVATKPYRRGRARASI